MRLSDCANAQASLGLCCPQIPEDRFSCVAALMLLEPANKGDNSVKYFENFAKGQLGHLHLDIA